jgi:hypothetical protein
MEDVKLIAANQHRLKLLAENSNIPSGFISAIVEATRWCDDFRAYQSHFQYSLAYLVIVNGIY